MITTARWSSLARLTVGNRSVFDAGSRLRGIMSAVRVPQDPPSSCTFGLLSLFRWLFSFLTYRIFPSFAPFLSLLLFPSSEPFLPRGKNKGHEYISRSFFFLSYFKLRILSTKINFCPTLDRIRNVYSVIRCFIFNLTKCIN